MLEDITTQFNNTSTFNPNATSTLNLSIPQSTSTFNTSLLNNLFANLNYTIGNPKLLDPVSFSHDLTPLNVRAEHLKQLNSPFKTNSMFSPAKIKYSQRPDGKFVDLYGHVLTNEWLDKDFSKKYTYDLMESMAYRNGLETDMYGQQDEETDETDETDESAGRNEKPNKSKLNLNLSDFVDKEKIANFLGALRAGVGIGVNNKVTQRALDAEKPLLQDTVDSLRSVYGDYRSLVQGQQAAAQLQNFASKPQTSDGALQQQMLLDATIKGQLYINDGMAKDDAMMKQTREAAWAQNKENQQARLATAMQNRLAMLMTEKNKANLLNVRDSGNWSQSMAPFLMQKEQELKTENALNKLYQIHFKTKALPLEVWKTNSNNLTENQKKLRDLYVNLGSLAVLDFVGTDENLKKEWSSLTRLMNEEIAKRQAALYDVNLNTTHHVTNDYSNFNPNLLNFNPTNTTKLNKKGGVIYKTILTSRHKDLDRNAKAIQLSKKIAAKFLEKTMDSLYTYKDIELVAKKPKRRYQAGGALPLVSYTPISITNPNMPLTDPDQVKKNSSSKKEDDDGITTKDVLELLKDMDGLPSDMKLLEQYLHNFSISDAYDPLNISSSADITSKYISLISKIKTAKFNKDEYNQAFNQLKSNGGLNEYAITSDGFLIGTDGKGDFQYFSPDLVNLGEPNQLGYQLLTNSNLLYLRANSTDAAFNHQIITTAQSGIGMEVITKQISDILNNLGSSKEGLEGFVQMGSSGQIKAGLAFLQKAAQQVGDGAINLNMSVEDYYQAGYLSEDLAQQAKLALQYIWGALPANAKSLLQVKGGSVQGAEALVQSLVYSKTNVNTQFKASPKKMSNSGSGSGSGATSDIDKMNLSPVQMMQAGYTDHQLVTLQKGTSYAMQINALVLPITDSNKLLLGITTLDKVASSMFGGALDFNSVTMGGASIDPHAVLNVLVDATNLYVMNLPIDRSAPDGTIKPDLNWMSKIEAIDKVIRDQNITDVNKINELYKNAGLPVLLDANGQLNTKDYCKFGVLNGHALNTAFKEDVALDNTVVEIEDESLIKNILNIINKGKNKEDKTDFDSKSWFDSIFGTSHDSLYEGTIYIPIRTNAFSGMIGGGNYPTAGNAAKIEALEQLKERTKGYTDPGLLTD